MIVGTAGHIDHGKTSLVKALTGTDTDRLPEEKRRGITVELGYAFLDLPQGGGRIAFVDVPGHERLVHTMVAGATGMDLALLLVAADDGVMPQTREHLAVLQLLGLSRGRVLITKADRADAGRIDAVRAQVAALVAGTFLADAAVHVLCAHSGVGLDELRTGLAADAAAVAQAGATSPDGFRLPIDRVFSLPGVGTVVTGSVAAGVVRVGDGVQLLPGGPVLRVRSVHAQNLGVDVAGPGQRCALGLVGIERQDIRRGQVLCAPEIASTGERLDVWLGVWRDETQPLRSGQRVFVHLGTESHLGTLAVLDPDVLAPGQSGLAQLILPAPVAAWRGDRLLLRDAAASRVLAGGRVLDPLGPQRYRRSPVRLATLSAQHLDGPAQRQQALLAAAALGLDVERQRRIEGRLSLGVAPERGDIALDGGEHHWLLAQAQAQALQAQVLQGLAAHHTQHPQELGPDAARLRRLAAPRLAEPLWRLLLGRWLDAGLLQRRGPFVFLPAQAQALSHTEQRIADKASPHLQAAGFEGAWVRDLARLGAEPEALVRVTLARLAQTGQLHQVVKDLYFPLATLERLIHLACVVAESAGGVVTAAAYRDATGLGRKRAIQILEYLDRIGLLRRVGDEHRLRPDSALRPGTGEIPGAGTP